MTNGIEKIDSNFIIETKIVREGLKFFDAKNSPFTLHGIFYENGQYARLPDSVAKSVNDGVHILSKHTAGGRVRFVTDSPYIVIKALQKGSPDMAHMPPSGQAGFDLYETVDGECVYRKSYMPAHNAVDGFEGVFDLAGGRERIFTLNFPLYFNVKELYIGIREGSVLKKAPDYTISRPIVFYGSSITQGGCASRPGNAYQGFLSRWYDADFINLGFSGSAKGERAMAEYIAGLDMSAFVYDYDYNAPSPEHLLNTHDAFYKIVRAAHPTIPIVFASRPKVALTADEKRRSEIVRATYEAALSRGENVYHVFGSELMAVCGDEGTVDGCHPTDLGFFSMAKAFGVEFDKFIDKVKK